MKLKELVNSIRYEQDILKVVKSINDFQENFVLDEEDYRLDEEDIKGLYYYAMSSILSIYEYIINRVDEELPQWFDRYTSTFCSKRFNYEYIIIKEIADKLGLNADEIYKSVLNSSPIEFSKRGISGAYFLDTSDN